MASSPTQTLLKAYRHSLTAETAPPELAEIPDDFDWEEFAQVCWGNTEGDIDSRGPYRVWAATQLPESAVEGLLQSIPGKRLFSHLDSPGYREAFIIVSRGFQRQVSVLKQPIVKKRLLQWLEEQPVERYPLLEIWRELNPTADVTVLRLAWNGPPQDFVQVVKGGARVAFPETPRVEKPVEKSGPDLADFAVKLKKAEQQIQQFKGVVSLRESEITRLKAHEAQEAANWKRKLEQQTTQADEQIHKVSGECDRLSRKLRAAETERDELAIENKRLQKQLRHLQQLVEAEKKKATEASKPQKPVEVVKPDPVAKAVEAPKGPLDEVFAWKADGRPVRLTVRAVRRLIDQNDEEAVFTIIQALDGLDKTDAALHKRFLQRLGEGEPFYGRVLTHETTRVLVDASNLARSVVNRNGKGQLKFLLEAREELRRRDCFPILLISDASLVHHINEPAKFRAMVLNNEIVMADKGVEADEMLAREARRTGATVVTNDLKFHHKVTPEYEPPRVGFRILDGTVIIEPF